MKCCFSWTKKLFVFLAVSLTSAGIFQSLRYVVLTDPAELPAFLAKTKIKVLKILKPEETAISKLPPIPVVLDAVNSKPEGKKSADFFPLYLESDRKGAYAANASSPIPAKEVKNGAAKGDPLSDKKVLPMEARGVGPVRMPQSETKVAPQKMPAGTAKENIDKDKEIFERLVDAYIYAYPLVLMNRMEKEMTASIFFAPKNKMSYFTLLPDARMRYCECPNVDSLMSMVWFDLSSEPQVICMPAEPNHHYLMELLDSWTNVITAFGDNQVSEYPTAKLGGRTVRFFVLTGPGTAQRSFPQGIKVVKSPTDSAWLINRVLLGVPQEDPSQTVVSASRTLYEFESIPYKIFEKETGGKFTAGSKISWLRSLPPFAVLQDFPYARPLTISERYAQNLQLPGKEESEKKSLPEKEQIVMEDEIDEEDDDDAVDTELEIEEEEEAREPEMIVQYYRTRYGYRPYYVRYAQQAGEKSKPAKKEGTLKKLEKKGEEDIKKAEKTMKKIEHHAETMIDRGAKDGARWTKEGIDYGRDAMEYMDRRMRRDIHRLARQFGSWFDWDNRSAMPDARVFRMSGTEFFETFASLLEKNPAPAADQKILESMKDLGLLDGEKKGIEPNTRTAYLMRFAIPFAQSKIRQTLIRESFRTTKDGNWILPEDLGRYGTNYLRRAAVAHAFIGANVPEQTVYPFTLLDKEGKFLNGKNEYVLHFPAGQTPPTDLLWSLTMYDQDHYLVDNRLNRFGIRSNQPLVFNQDGSLTIRIQKKEPKKMITNWLPAPEGEFLLMLRIYQPKDQVLKGEWKIPAVEKSGK
ncbi:MAG: DUF1214 domain-containing protein [Planctomycetia bacterium]|nr:DUF1214 domain-containing protein [Planctomycetia bacterium]